MLKKYLKQCALILLFSTQNVWADVGSDLSNFVDGLGFANASSASAYDTQTAGYVSFGSVYERNRVRDIQIMHIDVSGIRSGCGGIDIFAGGFSFIKADQLVKFMQNILSSGGGYAWNLALEVEMPEIAHSLQYVQDKADQINSGNFNSCQMSESLVGGLWPKQRSAQQQICQDIGSNSGFFSDWASARQGCSDGGHINEELDKAKSDNAYHDRVYKNTNIVWDKIIKRNSFLSSDQALGEMYMSISGTIVFKDNPKSSSDGGKQIISIYLSKLNDRNFIKSLLYGGKLPMYVCKDSGDSCLDVEYSQNSYQTIDPSNALVYQVRAQLSDIYNRVINNNTEGLTDKEKGLINMTQSPVFLLISANAQEHIGIQSLDSLSEMIATDILMDYLNDALNIIQSSLSSTQLDKENIKTLIESIQSAKNYVIKLDEQTRSRFQQALDMNLKIRQMLQQASSNLSPKLKEAFEGQEG